MSFWRRWNCVVRRGYGWLWCRALTQGTQESGIQVETRGHMRVIGINRPHRSNAINPRAADDLYQAFGAFDRDPEVHVAVLHGIGGNFCAGYDLKELASTRDYSQLPDTVGEWPSPMVHTHTLLIQT